MVDCQNKTNRDEITVDTWILGAKGNIFQIHFTHRQLSNEYYIDIHLNAGKI